MQEITPLIGNKAEKMVQKLAFQMSTIIGTQQFRKEREDGETRIVVVKPPKELVIDSGGFRIDGPKPGMLYAADFDSDSLAATRIAAMLEAWQKQK